MRSAFSRRLEQRTQEVRRARSPREKFQQLHSIIGSTPLLSLQAAYGSRIWAKVETENPGESHYDRCFLALMERMQACGEAVPGQAKLLEVTSGNAGVSFGWIGRMLGYATSIVLPPLPSAREQPVRETNDHVIPSRYPEQFLEGGVRTMREVAREAKRRNNPYILPDHSRRPETPRAFEEIGGEINEQLPPDVSLDVFACAIGNGTTITGISRSLRERHRQLLVHGFEDAAAATAYYKKYGLDPIASDTSVEMYGAGGARQIDMPYVSLEDIDRISLIQSVEWREAFEQYNTGKERPETIGRTSAAALHLAHRIIAEQRRAMNILVLFYDKADRYGEHIVTRDEEIYRGEGHWE